MKPKNFPKRKLIRKMKAEGIDVNSQSSQQKLMEARAVRTKKNRSQSHEKEVIMFGGLEVAIFYGITWAICVLGAVGQGAGW